MPRYRVLVGQHCEQTYREGKPVKLPDNTLAGRTYNMGDVFESPAINLLQVFPNKLERVYDEHGPALNDPNIEFWDKSKESIEQFTERMRQRSQASAEAVALSAAQVDQANGGIPLPATATATATPPNVPPLQVKSEKPLEQYGMEELKQFIQANELEIDPRKYNGNRDKLVAEIRRHLK